MMTQASFSGSPVGLNHYGVNVAMLPRNSRFGNQLAGDSLSVSKPVPKPDRKALLTRLLLLASVLLPFSPALKPASAQDAVPVANPVSASAREGDIDEVQHPFVDSKADVPQLNGSMRQAVVDLARSPLLTSQTRQELEQLLSEFNSSDVGQMALVVIPDTRQEELNTLATNLFNEIGVGHAGKNDGILMLVNKAAVQEGRSSGRMQIVSGTGIQNKLDEEQAVSLLRQYAVPHLRNGDYDAAVKDTVKGVIEFMKSGKDQPVGSPFGTDATSQWSAEDVSNAAVTGIIVLVVLALLVGAVASGLETDGGSGSGGAGSSNWGSFGTGSTSSSYSHRHRSSSSSSSRSSSNHRSSSWGGGRSSGRGGGI